MGDAGSNHAIGDGSGMGSARHASDSLQQLVNVSVRPRRLPVDADAAAEADAAATACGYDKPRRKGDNLSNMARCQGLTTRTYDRCRCANRAQQKLQQMSKSKLIDACEKANVPSQGSNKDRRERLLAAHPPTGLDLYCRQHTKQTPSVKHISWTPEMHREFYNTWHRCGGHCNLVAQDMALPYWVIRSHANDLSRAVKQPGHTMWGCPDLTEVPAVTKCWYCWKFRRNDCSARKQGNNLKDAKSCVNAPTCQSCGGICIDQHGQSAECTTRCKDCGQLGHGSAKSRLCVKQWVRACKTCSTCGGSHESKHCSLPKNTTTDANALKVCESKGRKPPSDRESLHACAKDFVDAAQRASQEKADRLNQAAKNEQQKLHRKIVQHDIARLFAEYLPLDPEYSAEYSALKRQPRRLHRFCLRTCKQLWRETRDARQTGKTVDNAYTRFKRHKPRSDATIERERKQKINSDYKAKTLTYKALREQQKQLGSLVLDHYMSRPSAERVLQILQKPEPPDPADTVRCALAALDAHKSDVSVAKSDASAAFARKLYIKQNPLSNPNEKIEGTTLQEVIEAEPQLKPISAKVPEEIKLWNGVKSRDEQWFPNQTEAQRRQRTDKEYRCKRFKREHQRWHDSYNPKKSGNAFARDGVMGTGITVDYGKPTVSVDSGVNYVEAVDIIGKAPESDKPFNARDNPFQQMKRKRIRRRSKADWHCRGLLMQRDHVKSIKVNEIKPAQMENTLKQHKARFEREQQRQASHESRSKVLVPESSEDEWVSATEEEDMAEDASADENEARSPIVLVPADVPRAVAVSLQ
jgi:hypothetical protein